MLLGVLNLPKTTLAACQDITSAIDLPSLTVQVHASAMPSAIAKPLKHRVTRAANAPSNCFFMMISKFVVLVSTVTV